MSTPTSAKKIESRLGTCAFAIMASYCLVSCTKAPVISDGSAIAALPAAKHSWTIPPGVFVRTDQTGQSEIDGLYPSQQLSDCCWLAPHAVIRFVRVGSAKHVDLTLVVSGMVPRYKVTRPRVSVSFAGAVLVDRSLPLGSTKVSLPIPDGLHGAGPFELFLSSSSFVPAREGITTDTRALGLILKKVETH